MVVRHASTAPAPVRAASIKEWDPNNELVLPPEYDPKKSRGDSPYVFKRRIFKKQMSAIVGEWRKEVAQWKEAEEKDKAAWLERKDEFVKLKAEEREKRHKIRMDIFNKHKEKADALRR